MSVKRNVWKKWVTVFLAAAVLVSTFGVINVKAEEISLFDNGEYTISKIENEDSVEVNMDGNCIDFNLPFMEENILVKGNLYKLEGVALYTDSLIVDVTESSHTILFCTLSAKPEFNGKVLLHCVIRQDQTKEIYIIETFLDQKASQEARKSFENIQAISLDHPMFEKLLLAGRWETLYIRENREQIGKEKVTTYIEDEQTFKDEENKEQRSQRDADIQNLRTYNVLTSVAAAGFQKILRENLNKEVIGFSICDVFKTSDSEYVSLIAIYDVNGDPSNDNDGKSKNVTFEVKRKYNYFVRAKKGKDVENPEIIEITQADGNSTYVVTANPGIGMRIIGDGTKGYFESVYYEEAKGGSSGSAASRLTNSVIKDILGKLCPFAGAVISAADYFADGLEVIEDWSYEDKKEVFKFKNKNSLYRKAAASKLKAQLYKRDSMVKITTRLVELEANSLSKIQFEYKIDVIGSQYYGDSKTYEKSFNFTVPLK